MRFGVVILFVLFAQCASSLKVLGIFPIASYSHYSLGRSLMVGLAEKGFDVTLVAPYTEKNAKYKTIELTGVHEAAEEVKKEINFYDDASLNFISWLLWVHGIGQMTTEMTLKHENVQKLLQSKESKFDVVIIERFANEAMHGFCHQFNAQCIVYCSIGMNYWTDYLVGNPSNPAYMPEMVLQHAGPMNLWQRTKNTFLSVSARAIFHAYLLPQQNDLLQRYFTKAPPIQKLLEDTSLVILNSHVTTTQPIAVVPNIVEIGGYHVSPPKKLPKDLEDFINSAKDGVVYFSMGSNLKSNEMPSSKREAILKAFSKLKQKVLWKFEDDKLPGQPDNLKISKWVPQQSVLAHPNTKLFITHGGLLSTIEAIYFGVPVIGIPIYGDQKMNTMEAVHAGYGAILDFNNLTEEVITDTLNEMLNNPSYTKNIKNRSKIMHDQPMKPIDRAAFWIEYVARHNGAKHLRSPAMDMTWYQLMLLDVFAVCAVVTVAAVVLIYMLFKCIKCIFCKKCATRAIKKKKS